MGSGRRPPVRVTINGHAYRSTVASMGGRYMLPVIADNRERAEMPPVDDIDVELDTEPREVDVPPDLRKALARHPDARRLFDGLSYTKKRELVVPIEQAKTHETRQRRIDKAVAALKHKRT